MTVKSDTRYRRQYPSSDGEDFRLEVCAVDDGVAFDFLRADSRLFRIVFRDAARLESWLEQVRLMAAEKRQAEAGNTPPLPIPNHKNNSTGQTIRSLYDAELVKSSPMRRIYYGPGALVTGMELVPFEDGGVSLFIYDNKQTQGEIKFGSHDVLESWTDEMLQLVGDFRHDTEGTAQLARLAPKATRRLS